MIYRDELGQPLQVGLNKTRYDFDFRTLAIPAGLETVLGGGAATFTNNPLPRLRLTTAATTGSITRLQTAFDISMTNLKVLELWADAFSPGSNGGELFFGMSGTNTGIRFVHDAAYGQSQIENVLATPTRQDSTYLLAGSSFVGFGRRIGLRWEPPRNKCWIMQYDSVEKEIDLTGVGSGVIRPSIGLKATTDAATQVGINSMSIYAEYD